MKSYRVDSGVVSTSSVGGQGVAVGCLSAVNPYGLWAANGGASTGKWFAYDDVDLLKMTVRCETNDPDDTFVYTVVNDVQIEAQVAVNTSTPFASWTGNFPVSAGDSIGFYLYNEFYEINNLVVQLWMNGPSGGKLFFFGSSGDE